MATIGFHASHEQFSPSYLLTCLKRAEAAGFQAASCSDHFHPWSERQGASGFAWSWLGSALEATKLTLGVVNAPGQRYHPAIIAQASATLCEMYPERFWLAVGSGENLNEHITGATWPSKEIRHRRLRESVDVMKALWAGETVNHQGTFIVNQAKLYTLPKSPPVVLGAALTPETSRWLGGWADGLITAGKETEDLNKVISTFREGGGEGKPIVLQVALSFANSDEEALAAAHDQWRVAGLTPQQLADVPTPRSFDYIADTVTKDTIAERIRVSADIQQQLAWLQRDIELGFDAIYINHVGTNLANFIDAFGEEVLPHLATEANPNLFSNEGPLDGQLRQSARLGARQIENGIDRHRCH
jgi:probable non-F420 flavinoid oxidoreductase